MEQNTKTGTKKKISGRKKAILITLALLGIVIGSDAYLMVESQQTARQAMLQTIAEAKPSLSVMQGPMHESIKDIYGTIRPKQSIDLFWQATGVVGEVMTAPGQTVKKGDVLAVLNPATINPDILAAGVTKEDKEVELERLFTSTTKVSAAYNAQVQAQKALADAEKTLSDLGVVRKDKLELGVYYQDYLEAKSSYDEAVKNFNTLKVRPLDDVDRQIAVEMMSGARSQMEQTLAKYNWYNGEVDTLKKQQAEADVILKEAELKDAQRAYDKIKDGPTENQINSLKSEIDAAQATLNTSKLIAPVDGTVSVVDTRQYDIITQTDLNQTPQKAALHLDDLSSYYIDVNISEMKINSVSVGMPVQIRFDAIPLKYYSGKIYKISNTGQQTGGEVTFRLVVKMDDPDERVKTGMTAELSIQTTEIPDALYVSKTAIGTGPNEKKYLIKEGPDQHPIIVPIETGVESGDSIQVISAELKAGDKVYPVSEQLYTAVNSLYGNPMFPQFPTAETPSSPLQ